jgi:hypothetical protein
VAGRLEHHQLAAGDLGVDVLTDLKGGDDVVAALQDQGWNRHLRQVGAVVGGKGRAGELPGDDRIGAAEAFGQFFAELWPVGVADDRRGHGLRPAHRVVGQKLSSSSICAAPNPPM